METSSENEWHNAIDNAQPPKLKQNLMKLKMTGTCEECDLAGANLRGIEYTGASPGQRYVLTGANLEGADLSGAFALPHVEGECLALRAPHTVFQVPLCC